MVNFSLILILASSLSTLASPTTERTLGGLEVALKDLTGHLTILNRDIHAFSAHGGGTLRLGLKIHTDGLLVEEALSKCSDATVGIGSVSDGDAQNVLHLASKFEPIIIDALSGIVEIKVALENLPIGGLVGLVKVDLRNLNTGAVNLGTDLIALCPTHYKPEATRIKKSIDLAFGRAKAAYA